MPRLVDAPLDPGTSPPRTASASVDPLTGLTIVPVLGLDAFFSNSCDLDAADAAAVARTRQGDETAELPSEASPGLHRRPAGVSAGPRAALARNLDGAQPAAMQHENMNVEALSSERGYDVRSDTSSFKGSLCARFNAHVAPTATKLRIELRAASARLEPYLQRARGWWGEKLPHTGNLLFQFYYILHF
jgi:hypothetical protein